MSKIPTGLFGRGTKLLGMATKVAIKETLNKARFLEDEKQKLLNRIELAQDVVKTLSSLKGASMKLGQLLSLDLGDYLPPEIQKVLTTLHQDSTFLPFDEIEKILQKELGENFSELTNISSVPIAAASIGQVHRAVWNNKEIVLKVQYPGVAESIPSDLRILEMIIDKALLFQGKRDLDISELINEVKEVMLKEADYLHEQKMHLLYSEKFKDSDFRVPEVYPHLSTGKVLAMEFIEGKNFTRWLETNPPRSDKENIAHLFMKLYLTELLVHGLVQTDPNPGNFLIDKHNTIALLDFGATKIYSIEFVTGYREVLLASYVRDHERLLKVSHEMNLIDPRETKEAVDIYLEMMDFLVEPFRANSTFDFTDKEFFNRSKDLSWEMSKKCKFTPPPKDLIFLHRKLGGVFAFLKKLDVKIKLSDYWPYVEAQSAQK